MTELRSLGNVHAHARIVGNGRSGTCLRQPHEVVAEHSDCRAIRVLFSRLMLSTLKTHAHHHRRSDAHEWVHEIPTALSDDLAQVKYHYSM